MQGKLWFKAVALILMASMLLPMSLILPVWADTDINKFPRLEEVYQTIVYPEATAMSYARAGYIDNLMGMINPDNVEELQGGAEGIVLRPNAAGTFTQWTAVGAASNWECVDETLRDDDTTYVKSLTNLDQDSYNLQDSSETQPTIKRVTVLGYARCILDPAEKIHLKVVIGGTSYYAAAARALTTSYAVYKDTWATNPAGGDWDWTAINALEAGFKHVVDGLASAVRVTQVYVEVWYNNGTADLLLTLRPNADGTFTQWTPVGATPNWNCTEEVAADGDLTYVYSTADGTQDSYNLEDTAETGTIYNVTVAVRARYINGYDKIKFKVVVGGNSYYGTSTYTLGKDYQVVGNPLTESWTKNPATGNDWTWAEINALQVGFQHLVADTADEVRVTMLWVEVAFVRGEARGISMNPGFHMCYLGINCRTHPPELGPEEPHIPGAPYGYRGPDFELWPLNESDFRLALNYLIGCQKDAWIASLYRFINVRLDTTVPPANVFYYNPEIQPVPYNATAALELLNGLGWSNSTGKWIHTPSGRELRPIYVLSPAPAPPSVALTGYCVESWNNFFGTTDSPGYFDGYYFKNFAVESGLISDLAWCNRDFDIYFLCWGLGRDPDSLYFFFHPDMDYYDGYNSPGLRTPNNELEDMLYALEYWVFPEGTVAEIATNPAHENYVGMTVDSVEEMQKVVYEIQWWLYYLVPYIPLYSRNYINAYRPGLVNWIESKGYGSHNDWTYGWIFWEDLTKTSINWHDGGTVYTLNPFTAVWAYEWQILNRLFDGFITVNPFLHTDINWAIKKYSFERFNGTTPNGNYCDGSYANFTLRPGIKWHDGTPFNATDVKYAWEFINTYKTRTGSTIWITFVEANIISEYEIEVYYNATGIWVLYDYAGVAMMVPRQIYAPNKPADLNNDGILTKTEVETFQPWKVAHPSPPAELPWLTCLIGTGQWIFRQWDVVANKVWLVANRNYWAGNFLRQDVNFDGKVDMKDVTKVLRAFGAYPGHPRWYYGESDVGGGAKGQSDGKVDMKDVTSVLKKFGKITLPA